MHKLNTWHHWSANDDDYDDDIFRSPPVGGGVLFCYGKKPKTTNVPISCQYHVNASILYFIACRIFGTVCQQIHMHVIMHVCLAHVNANGLRYNSNTRHCVPLRTPCMSINCTSMSSHWSFMSMNAKLYFNAIQWITSARQCMFNKFNRIWIHKNKF